MALPQHVRRAVRAAEKLHADVYDPKPPVDPNAPPAEGDPNAPPPEPTDEPSEAPAPVSEPPAGETPEQMAARLVAELETSKQRYLVLQGKYNVELPRERQRAEMLEGLLSSVTTRQAEPTPPAPTQETPPELRPSSLLTEADKEAFGEEFIDFTRRAAREVVEGEMQRFSAQLSEIKQSVQGARQTAGITAEQMTQQQLDTLCPTWRGLNNDQGFLDWLKNRDVFAGEFRNTLIKQAYAANDAARVAAFFNAYLQEQTTVSPPAQPAPAPSVIPQTEDTRRPSLETLAAPGAGKPTVAPAAPDKKVWTPTLISQFYTQIQRGYFRGREAERKKIEADIFVAQREGRFRPT